MQTLLQVLSQPQTVCVDVINGSPFGRLTAMVFTPVEERLVELVSSEIDFRNISIDPPHPNKKKMRDRLARQASAQVFKKVLLVSARTRLAQYWIWIRLCRKHELLQNSKFEY